jgi:hypothetical protein
VFEVHPAASMTTPAEDTVIAWQPGHEATHSFVLRLGNNAKLMESSAPEAPLKEYELKQPEFHPKGLLPGTTYYWRVDQLDASGKLLVRGDVRQFHTDAGPASSPLPRDHVALSDQNVTALSWTPGRYAISQRLFFGDDAQAVADGSIAPKALDAKTETFALPAALSLGRRYYWRVEEDNGPLPPSRGQVWAFRTADKAAKDDVTFYVGSDCHYGLGNNAELNRKVIDEMNWVPGTTLPAQAGGGSVRTPRGVVLDGDLLDKGFEPKTAPAAWAGFVQDYGLNGTDGRLAFPVYEGFGNHDGMTGKSVSRAGIQQRNRSRVGLTAISANGFHYSWDWDNIHLVQLNLFPGKDSGDCIVGPPNHDPEDSLGFLQEDLAKHVGQSGRLVLIFCHYCYSGGMADWWTDAAKDRFRDTVKPYRVVLIHGHSHGAYFYTWKGVQVISDGATARPEGQTGDFMVVHVSQGRLTAAQRKLGEWGVCLNVAVAN